MKIIEMDKSDILNLKPIDVPFELSGEELVHIAKQLGAFWSYDYSVADKKPGLHALLKSELHSDGFFVSKILLAHDNILQIMAHQIELQISKANIMNPDWIVGVPDGATKLGEAVGNLLTGTKIAEMEKNEEGNIVFKSKIPDGDSLLFIEDFFTRGTGFGEAVVNTLITNPGIIIKPYAVGILNRGGLRAIHVPLVSDFKIIVVANHRIQDWEKEECELCLKYGSKPIKPKATDENWQLITNSQL